MNRTLPATLAAGAWINLSEFLRNEVLFKSRWVDHYDRLGLVFPSTALTNVLWVVWGFLAAALVVRIAARFSFTEAVLIGWGFTFALMWLVIGNLAVLPHELLPVAVPWSVVEVVGAVWIARRLGV